MNGTKLAERMEEEFIRMSRPIFSPSSVTKAAVTPASTVSRLERERYKRRGTDAESGSRRMLRGCCGKDRARRASAASRIGRLAGWSVGRSVGVADSNGRRSVSRLLRGSYVNMETGSWNPVLDSTYDSNQHG